MSYYVEFTFAMFRGERLPREFPFEVRDSTTNKTVHYARTDKEAKDWIKENSNGTNSRTKRG